MLTPGSISPRAHRVSSPPFIAAALLLALPAACSGGKSGGSGSSGGGSSEDDSCTYYCDWDGDGYFLEDGDCDDSDPDVNPGANEDCTNAIDDDCNGIITTCVHPELVYDPTAPEAYDPYSAAVFADRVVFGEPQTVGFSPGDGQALFFELESGIVDETDAALVSSGEVGAEGAYGSVLTPVGGSLCIGADYYDYGTIDNVGRSWCFSDATVRAASGTLPLASAEYNVKSTVDDGYSAVDAELDVDDDGHLDLVVYTAQNIHVILGDGTPWSGDYVSSDLDYGLGNCEGSSSGWCGFGRAVTSELVAVSNEGSDDDEIYLYTLPPPGGGGYPTDITTLDRAYFDSAVGSESLSVAMFGNSNDDEVNVIDADGASTGTISGPEDTMFGYWLSTFEDQDLHELLLVSARLDVEGSTGTGVVYVFDLTANGLPSSTDEAVHVLTPPDGMEGCGNRARGGIVSNQDGVATTVAVSCPGYGGAAYVLDLRPPPLPVNAISPLGLGHFEVQQWVVDAYTANLSWILGLAEVEQVTTATGATGWKLSSVEPGTPLYRAGLRNDDIIRKVNGNTLDSVEVIQSLYQSLQGSTSLTLTVIRNGQSQDIDYDIVP